jgi:glycogen debranching enzyme
LPQVNPGTSSAQLPDELPHYIFVQHGSLCCSQRRLSFMPPHSKPPWPTQTLHLPQACRCERRLSLMRSRKPYSRRSPKGLTNQGWKDSWDAYMRPDRSVAPPPIAPIEVQGYVYDAKYRMASLLRNFGDAARAEKLRKEATELARRLDKAYWMSDRNYFAMALDGEKQQLKCIASNPGHLLFSRAVTREKSRAIVTRLMREDMFSGWGWRTLSQDEPTFNPLSYHRGSVWPHDNSLIAHGMSLNETQAACHPGTNGFVSSRLKLPQLPTSGAVLRSPAPRA